MTRSRRFPSYVLALVAVWFVSTCGTAIAGGGRASRSEIDAYARLEGDSRGLEAFSGGGSAGSDVVLPLRRGTGDSATSSEAASYAKREAASPGLENFEGGSLEGLVVALAVVAAIVIIVWLVIPWK